MSSGRFSAASFTYTGDIIAFKQRIEELYKRGSITYVHAQIEEGEDGTVHLQGMVQCKYQQQSSYFQKNFGPALDRDWETRL